MDTVHSHRTLYLSHGGGPLPLLGEESHTEMVACLRTIASQLPRPTAIMVVSAHWEEGRPTLTSGDKPELIYDYSGFPKEAYEISYPAPGAPDLAHKTLTNLEEAGLQPAVAPARGFDHGLFIPLKIMYPEADIPCLQLSLVRTLDPEVHIRIGEALSRLHHPGLLVIGSGFSFHNMRAFFQRGNGEDDARNSAFEDWLIVTCTDQAITETRRRQRLVDWQQAPHARFCHPREEHLLPLHVCYGIHGRASNHSYTLPILGKRASFFLW